MQLVGISQLPSEVAVSLHWKSSLSSSETREKQAFSSWTLVDGLHVLEILTLNLLPSATSPAPEENSLFSSAEAFISWLFYQEYGFDIYT